MDRNFIGSHSARILQLMYFMLPAYLANMTPPFVRFWRGWNRPISRRWLGDHKTVIGFIGGMIVALAVAFCPMHSVSGTPGGSVRSWMPLMQRPNRDSMPRSL